MTGPEFRLKPEDSAVPPNLAALVDDLFDVLRPLVEDTRQLRDLGAVDSRRASNLRYEAAEGAARALDAATVLVRALRAAGALSPRYTTGGR